VAQSRVPDALLTLLDRVNRPTQAVLTLAAIELSTCENLAPDQAASRVARQRQEVRHALTNAWSGSVWPHSVQVRSSRSGAGGLGLGRRRRSTRPPLSRSRAALVWASVSSRAMPSSAWVVPKSRATNRAVSLV
jgi:hypothetical protein